MIRKLRELEPFDDAGVLLRFLLDTPTAHFTVAELATALGWDSVRVEDAVAEIERGGLAHHFGPFVFPTHAAVRAAELLA
jgi:hypothetical protein